MNSSPKNESTEVNVIKNFMALWIHWKWMEWKWSCTICESKTSEGRAMLASLSVLESFFQDHRITQQFIDSDSTNHLSAGQCELFYAILLVPRRANRCQGVITYIHVCSKTIYMSHDSCVTFILMILLIKQSHLHYIKNLKKTACVLHKMQVIWVWKGMTNNDRNVFFWGWTNTDVNALRGGADKMTNGPSKLFANSFSLKLLPTETSQIQNLIKKRHCCHWI